MIGAIRRRERRDDETGQQDARDLAALVRDCVLAGIGRQVCVVHLSRLGAERARPHHLRLARSALEPLAHADRARVFTLPNQDLVTIWRGPAMAALAASRAAIAHLFADDAPDGAVDALWEEMELPEAAARLLEMVERPERAEVTAPRVAAPPLDPQALARLEAGLAQADVARFARRRQVCARLPDGRFRLRWEKRFLSVDELMDSLAPDYAAQGDPWLFRRLTRTLDRRMLALLAAPGELAEAGPFAINLNVSSILSPEFLRFDAMLPAHLRGQVTLDLLPEDVLADPGAFQFARDFARSRFYRLLLRGITADLVAVFPAARMGVDFLQMPWSQALAAAGMMLSPDDAARVIVSRCHQREALEWGVGQGIGLFQGDAVQAAVSRGAES